MAYERATELRREASCLKLLRGSSQAFPLMHVNSFPRVPQGGHSIRPDNRASAQAEDRMRKVGLWRTKLGETSDALQTWRGKQWILKEQY